MTRHPSDQSAFPLLRAMCDTREGSLRLIRQLSKNVRHDPDGCIEYMTKIGADTHGISYPRIRITWKGQTKQVYAHRLFWMLREKRPVPDGMEVGHLCNNVRCVRHVEVVTKAENVVEVNKRVGARNVRRDKKG